MSPLLLADRFERRCSPNILRIKKNAHVEEATDSSTLAVTITRPYRTIAAKIYIFPDIPRENDDGRGKRENFTPGQSQPRRNKYQGFLRNDYTEIIAQREAVAPCARENLGINIQGNVHS